MVDPWASPEELPPETENSSIPGTIILSDGVVPKLFPTPILGAELDPVVRPSPSVCFPLHPIGVLKLYGLARAAQNSFGSVEALGLDRTDAQELYGATWSAARHCYLPGEPLRSGFDRLVEQKYRGFRFEDVRESVGRVQGDRIRLLAVHFLALALGEWAEDAKA
jgi:hypothetical protein